MIEELTEEQKALFPVYQKKWLEIGLSTKPLDYEAAKIHAASAYKVAELEPPKRFFRFTDPLTAVFGILTLIRLDEGVHKEKKRVRTLRNEYMDNISLRLSESVFDQIKDQVKGEFTHEEIHLCMDSITKEDRSEVTEHFNNFVFGAHSASWLSYYNYFQDQFGLCEKIVPLIEMAQVCGWWSPYKNVAAFQDRPSVIKFDDQDRLHCPDGPVITYPGGVLNIYAWHGVLIPAAWIQNKLPSAAEALALENIEQRRACCEMIGWATILEELDSVVINDSNDPQIGKLLEVEIPDSGKERFLIVTCGTGREGIAIPVPPELTTALEAGAWTYGVAPEDYHPEVRT